MDGEEFSYDPAPSLLWDVKARNLKKIKGASMYFYMKQFLTDYIENSRKSVCGKEEEER